MKNRLTLLLIVSLVTPALVSVYPVHATGTLTVHVDESVELLVQGPMAGAKVVSVVQPSGQTVLNCTTDSHGNVTFTNIAVGTYTIRASADHYQEAVTQVTVTDGVVATVYMKLELLGLITGTVYARNYMGDFVALAAANVTAHNGTVAISTLTMANGSYELWMAPSMYNITVSHKYLDPTRIQARQVAITWGGVAAGQDLYLEMLMWWKAYIRGTVRAYDEAGQLQPVASVKVEAIPSDTSVASANETFTSASGEYNVNVWVNVLQSELYTLRFSHPLYPEGTLSQQINVRGGMTIDGVDFIMNSPPTAGRIMGQVYGRDHLGDYEPLVGATVKAVGQTNYSTTTGSNGTFTLELVAGRYVITASLEGYISSSTEMSINAGSETTVNFYLEQSATPQRSVPTSTGSGTVTLATDAGNFTSVAGVSEATLPSAGKPNLIFPHGFFSFRVDGLTTGATITVNITLPSNLPVNAQYWKNGPTPNNTASHWYQLPMEDNDGDNVIKITLIDGGLGDDDLTANSVIVDQGGPGIPTPHQGCIIATATYGSGLAPEVVYMRHVRDDIIGSNSIGRKLVDGWNTFYYSWSPPIAEQIEDSETLQYTFRIALLPLVGVIHITELVYTSVAQMNAELASVVAFAVASFLSVIVYIVVPALAVTILGREALELFLKFRSLQDSIDSTRTTSARLQVRTLEDTADCPISVNTSELHTRFSTSSISKRSSLHVGRR